MLHVATRVRIPLHHCSAFLLHFPGTNSTHTTNGFTTSTTFPTTIHVCRSPHGSLTTRTNIPPDSAKAHLRKSHGLQVWREEDINIADARLVGPFNFTLLRVPAIPNKRRATTKHNLIDSSIWTKLEVVLDEQGIDRTSIHRIVPCNFAEMLPCCSHYF